MTEFAQRINEAAANANRAPGSDATVRMMVNGEAITRTYASNDIDLDGMTVTLKGNINDLNATDEVNKAKAVSFTTAGGSDDLIKTITSFVNDYNAILKEVHDAYATMPAEKSSSTHEKYEPLSDDDKNSMSDKAVENYEAKAKQGLLFGDSDLRALYETLVRNINPGGSDGAALRNIGISVSYSDNTAQITLDETKLRDALNKDPDSVTNVFTRSKEGGSNSDGLMSNVKTTMEQYASTSFVSPGVLVRKAGNKYSSTSLLNNDLQKQLDNVQKKIEQWQSKMSTKIDYYTRQFTALEKLMNTMNSQSSALAGLMGG
jgi:flagellar hook-associated protein 2